MEVPVLTTPRLELSVATPEDAEDVFPFVHGEAGRVVTDMLLWDGPESVDELRTYYAEYAPTVEPESTSFQWMIRDRTGAVSGRAGRGIGSIGIRLPAVPGPAEFGYWLAPPYWRSGLMSEAITAVGAHTLSQSAATVLRADVFITNRASQRLLEGLGFRCVETIPELHTKRGVPMDCYRYEARPEDLPA